MILSNSTNDLRSIDKHIISENPVINDIFTKIKNEYSVGLKALFRYIEKNPSIDISAYMNSLPNTLREKVNQDLKGLKDSNNLFIEKGKSRYNFQEFQKKLSVMKEKYGISTVNPQIEVNTTLNDLKAKENTLLNKTPVSEDQNTLNELKTRIQNLNRLK